MEPAARDDSHLSADPSWLEACKAIGDDLDAIVAQNVAAYDTLGGQGERNRKRGTIVYLVSFFLFVRFVIYLFTAWSVLAFSCTQNEAVPPNKNMINVIGSCTRN